MSTTNPTPVTSTTEDSDENVSKMKKVAKTIGLGALALGGVVGAIALKGRGHDTTPVN